MAGSGAFGPTHVLLECLSAQGGTWGVAAVVVGEGAARRGRMRAPTAYDECGWQHGLHQHVRTMNDVMCELSMCGRNAW